jgi:tRNA(adenine34) deaminase
VYGARHENAVVGAAAQSRFTCPNPFVLAHTAGVGNAADDERFVRQAIAVANSSDGAPYGAVVVDSFGGTVVSEGHDASERSPVAHDVTMAIEHCPPDLLRAGDRLTVYATAEPCAMCASAIVWAGIGRVVFGTSAATLVRVGARGIDIGLEEIVRRSFRAGQIDVVGGVLEHECDALYHA